MAAAARSWPGGLASPAAGASAEAGAAPREYIRFEIVDFHGKALSKTVPARHRNGKVYMYSGALAMGANSEVLTFPDEVSVAGCPNGELLPDWSTEQVLPWACRPERGIQVRRVYCEQATILKAKASGRNEIAPRAVCRRLLEELKAFGNQGLELMMGGELEFTFAKPSAAGGAWEPLFDGVDIFATMQNNKAMDLCYEVERLMEPVGVDLLTMNAEYGAGQIEMAFAPKFGIEAADMTATFRTGVKEIAQQQGLRACFMSKPFGVRGVGNGGHFNFSLWTAGAGRAEAGGQEEDAVARAAGGRMNVFHSTADADGLSPTARAFLAGILAHAPAMEALCSPTPPCYCRHGNWAPDVANWGPDDRSACVRVKAGKSGSASQCYMELRMPSASANPYLVAAAVAAAGLDGLQRSLELPPARQNAAAGAVKLPTSLPDALTALEADAYMQEQLGPDFVRWYVSVKRAELEAIEARLSETRRSDDDVSAAWQHMFMEYV
mmetsp:Transcript_86370/g.279669  ORF Transcript_86370/g.279669 Transcript_86370/m.279669 type:complete len:495 (-) Transcript_86370:15-1499(-)